MGKVAEYELTLKVSIAWDDDDFALGDAWEEDRKRWVQDLSNGTVIFAAREQGLLPKDVDFDNVTVRRVFPEESVPMRRVFP